MDTDEAPIPNFILVGHGYRKLEDNEIVQAGDEWNCKSTGYTSFSATQRHDLGKSVACINTYRGRHPVLFRRKLGVQPQAQEPKVTVDPVNVGAGWRRLSDDEQIQRGDEFSTTISPEVFRTATALLNYTVGQINVGRSAKRIYRRRVEADTAPAPATPPPWANPLPAQIQHIPAPQDPGHGYRLLGDHEQLMPGDQINRTDGTGWFDPLTPENIAAAGTMAIRRRSLRSPEAQRLHPGRAEQIQARRRVE